MSTLHPHYQFTRCRQYNVSLSHSHGSQCTFSVPFLMGLLLPGLFSSFPCPTTWIITNPLSGPRSRFNFPWNSSFAIVFGAFFWNPLVLFVSPTRPGVECVGIISLTPVHAVWSRWMFNKDLVILECQWNTAVKVPPFPEHQVGQENREGGQLQSSRPVFEPLPSFLHSWGALASLFFLLCVGN